VGNDPTNGVDVLGMACDKLEMSTWAVAGFLRGFGVALAIEYGLKTAVRLVAAQGAPVVGQVVAVGLAAWQAYNLYHAIDSIVEHWDEIRSGIEALLYDPELQEMIRCLSQDQCNELSDQIGAAFGSVIAGFRGSIKAAFTGKATKTVKAAISKSLQKARVGLGPKANMLRQFAVNLMKSSPKGGKGGPGGGKGYSNWGGEFIDDTPYSSGSVPERLPNRFEGVQHASRYLQDMRVPRDRRVEILQSFEVDAIRVRPAGASEFGLRYFSDPNRAGGSYLFETFPASRSSLAIKPEWSTMSGFRQFQVRPGATILEGPAAAQGAYLPGGQTQKFILDWRNDLLP
jgi:hypothetical protein